MLLELLQFVLFSSEDVSGAEKAEARLTNEQSRLEEELSEARCRAEAEEVLLQHLQHAITTLQSHTAPHAAR